MKFVDWSMLAFWGSQCHFLDPLRGLALGCLLGTFGRYNGVFLITLYTVVYFLVTRFFSGSVSGIWICSW